MLLSVRAPLWQLLQPISETNERCYRRKLARDFTSLRD